MFLKRYFFHLFSCLLLKKKKPSCVQPMFTRENPAWSDLCLGIMAHWYYSSQFQFSSFCLYQIFSGRTVFKRERINESKKSQDSGRISVSNKKKKFPGKDNLRWTLKGQEKILSFQGDEPFNYHLDNNQIHFLPKNKAVLFSSSRHFSQLILRKIEENL